MQRKIEFDIMKGICIILVMLGHTSIFYHDCTMPTAFERIAFSFHVPLFFILAGYFSKPYSEMWRESVKNYTKRLVVPYIVTTVIILFYLLLLSAKRSDISIFTNALFSYIVDDYSCVIHDKFGFAHYGVGPVWFLLALYWAKVLFLFVSKFGKWTVVICLIISIVGSEMCKLFPLPFGLWQGVTALGFVAAGYWYRQHKLPLWAKVIGVLIWVVSLFVTGVNPYMACYPMYLLNLVAACGAAFVIYWLSVLISKLPVLSSVFVSLGQNSMNILCVHTIDMKCNIVRVIIKQIPMLSCCHWLAMFIDYVVTILLSYSPKWFRTSKK